MRLKSKPKGDWYCPECRGHKPSVMKPREKESTRTRDTKKPPRFSFELFTSQKSKESKEAAKVSKEAKADKVKKKGKKTTTADALANFIAKGDSVFRQSLTSSESD